MRWRQHGTETAQPGSRARGAPRKQGGAPRQGGADMTGQCVSTAARMGTSRASRRAGALAGDGRAAGEHGCEPHPRLPARRERASHGRRSTHRQGLVAAVGGCRRQSGAGKEWRGECASSRHEWRRTAPSRGRQLGALSCTCRRCTLLRRQAPAQPKTAMAAAAVASPVATGASAPYNGVTSARGALALLEEDDARLQVRARGTHGRPGLCIREEAPWNRASVRPPCTPCAAPLCASPGAAALHS